MPDDTVKREILEAVEAGFEAQVAFLGDLVRIPSLRSAEAPTQDFMAEAYRTRGYGVGDGPKIYNIRLGTARQRDSLPPKTQYWFRSAQHWVTGLGPVEAVEKQ